MCQFAYAECYKFQCCFVHDITILEWVIADTCVQRYKKFGDGKGNREKKNESFTIFYFCAFRFDKMMIDFYTLFQEFSAENYHFYVVLVCLFSGNIRMR